MFVETGNGRIPQSELTWNTRAEDRGGELVNVREWTHQGKVVRQEADTPVPKVDGCISTTAGMVDVDDLDTKLVETDEGETLVLAAERRVKATGELVRRDVWVTVKRAVELGVMQGDFNG